MYVPLAVVGDQWGVSYLEKIYQIDEKVAASIIALMWIGVALGAPSFMILADFLNKRRIPMFLSALFAFISYAIIVFLHDVPLGVMYVLFFMGGFFFGGQNHIFACVTETVPTEVSGVAIGFSNMVVMLSGALSLPLVGYILDLESTSFTAAGTAIYSASDFRIAFILVPICLGAAVLLTRFMRETYPGNS